MTTLFERLTGDFPGTSADKIPIHPFMAALYELERGNLTGNNVTEFFRLDEKQASDGALLMSYVSAAKDRADMLRVIKDWLYLAEWGRGEKYAKYFSQDNFLARLDQEKTRQKV